MFSAINYADITQVRCISKHWNPKWKKERREKVIKIKLPSFEDANEDDPTNMNKEEVRSRMKEHGFLPQKPWQERPTFISCTPTIFESYVAPEGDGKYSAVTKEVYFVLIYCTNFNDIGVKDMYLLSMYFMIEIGCEAKVNIFGKKGQIFDGH